MKRLGYVHLTVLAFAAGAASGPISTADAQTFSSSYTSTAPRDCRMIGKPSELDGSTSRVCPGKAGLVVSISEDDLRETVSVGRNRAAAAKEPAAQSWFGPFNSTINIVNGAPSTARRSRSSSAGTSPTTAIRTRRAGRPPSRCWR